MKKSSPFVSVTEIARRRGLSRPTIRALIRAGQISTNEQGRILRAPFEEQLERLAAISREATNVA